MIIAKTCKFKDKKPNDLKGMIMQLNSFKTKLGDNIKNEIDVIIKNLNKSKKNNSFSYFDTNKYIKSSKYTADVVKMENGKKIDAGKFIGQLVKSIIYSSKSKFILYCNKKEWCNIYICI